MHPGFGKFLGIKQVLHLLVCSFQPVLINESLDFVDSFVEVYLLGLRHLLGNGLNVAQPDMTLDVLSVRPLERVFVQQQAN